MLLIKLGIIGIFCRSEGEDVLGLKDGVETVSQILYSFPDDPFIAKNCFWALGNFCNDEGIYYFLCYYLLLLLLLQVLL